MGTALLVIGVIYFLAHLLANSFSRSRVPDVLGLMLFGVVIGPVLRLVPREAFGEAGPVLTTIALSVILFESGTTLGVRTIVAGARHLLWMTLATSITTALIVAVGAVLLGGLSWEAAALLGVIVSGTSSAVVIPLVKVLRTGPAAGTVLTLESALTDVLCIVATFALMRGLSAEAVPLVNVLGSVVAALVLASLLGIVTGIVWFTVWNSVRAIPNAMFTPIAVGFVIYGLAELLGFSGPIAVLAFGVTLANADGLARWPLLRRQPLMRISEQEKAFLEEMVFLLKTFFFVFLGLSMHFPSFTLTLAAAVVLAAVYVARLVITRWVVPEWSLRDRQIASLMIPKGLAAAVLAGVPLQAGVPGGEVIRDWAYQIVFVSIVITALLGALLDVAPVARWYGRVLAPPPPRGPEAQPRQTPENHL